VRFGWGGGYEWARRAPGGLAALFAAVLPGALSSPPARAGGWLDSSDKLPNPLPLRQSVVRGRTLG